jgi:hypothetical protein
MPISSGAAQFQALFSTNPIILTGGIAIGQGGALPLLSIGPFQGAVQFPGGTPDQIAFKPLPGSTLISQEVSRYPFANQAIAANAVIAQPLNLSLVMAYPATSYSLKQSILASLQATLSQHNALGGLYNVFTPAFVYTNGLLLALRDISSGDDKQVQYLYQWDFYFPLVTINQAQSAQAALNNKLNNLSQGSAPVTTANAATALTNTGNPDASNQVQNNLTSGLQTQLQSAGVPTNGLTDFVQATFSGAISGGLSTTDLQGNLFAGLLPGASAVGLPIAMLKGIVAGAVNSAFGAVGVTLGSLTTLGVSSLQSAPTPASLGVNSPLQVTVQ